MEGESSSRAVLEKNREPDDGNRWEWLKRGGCNRETEILLCAAKEQAL